MALQVGSVNFKMWHLDRLRHECQPHKAQSSCSKALAWVSDYGKNSHCSSAGLEVNNFIFWRKGMFTKKVS